MALPLPFDVPDLTLADGSTATLRRVYGACLQQLWSEFARLPVAAVPETERALYHELLAVCGRVQRRDPRRILAALRMPTLSTLLRCIVGHAGPARDYAALGRWLREAAALLLLDLAATADLGVPVTLGPGAEGQMPRLLAPALNLEVTAEPRVRAWRLRDGHLDVLGKGEVLGTLELAQIPAAGLPACTLRRPYCEIVPGTWLALADNNPLSDFEAHPDKRGNTLDLGDRPLQDWLAALRSSCQAIERHLPLLFDEMRLLLRLVVPVGWHPEKHLSASYQEAVGLVYLTLHPQEMTMTEALIHEFQHNKLNALFTLDPLLHNAFAPLYPSPVRPDPRPLHGVVLAVHAFQPVAMLYRHMLAQEPGLAANRAFVQRFRTILRMNRAGAHTVLANGQPTLAGRAVLAEMRRLDDEFTRYEAVTFGTVPATEGEFFDAALADA
ncbi:MAG: hypothetical protein EXR79_11630 [Myxococcales bacterium]|nr:hypothetical protein [Myxococcales bacterium]